VAATCDGRDAELTELGARHEKEMKAALAASTVHGEVGGEQAAALAAERQINALVNRHVEERQTAELKWESDLLHVRETQHREFRDWVMAVHEELKVSV